MAYQTSSNMVSVCSESTEESKTIIIDGLRTPPSRATLAGTASPDSGDRSQWICQLTPTTDISPVSLSPPSVKSLTCYYWFHQGRCKHSAEDCLYAHTLTGKVANAPVQMEEGRPAVAGRNASNPNPVYFNWRDATHKQRIHDPTIQQQLAHINTKAQNATPTFVKREPIQGTNTPYFNAREDFHGNTVSPSTTHPLIREAPGEIKREQYLQPYGRRPLVSQPNTPIQERLSSPNEPEPTAYLPDPFTGASYASAPRKNSRSQSATNEAGYIQTSPWEHSQQLSSPYMLSAHPIFTNSQSPTLATPADHQDVPMAYHLACYHSPTAEDRGLHQLLCPRPTDHTSPKSIVDSEMLRNLVIKNQVINDLSKALDIAIKSLEGQEKSSTKAQIEKLASLATDDRFEITYVGQNIAATTPSGRVRYSETPDYRQKIAGVAEVLLENQDVQAQQSRNLNRVRSQVLQQMESIGAQSQLPQGWNVYQ